MSLLKLTEIWIYPVKSLGGISLSQAKVLKKGLQYDRRYMLVDENSQFITQRRVHELALFKLSIVKDGFLISFKDETVQLPFTPKPSNNSVRVTIWNDIVDAYEVGVQISEWFSGKLNLPCRLVYFPEENERQVDRNFVSGKEQVSLADGYPFLLIGQSSLDDLNSRLKEPVPMNRFRPNFVFEGGDPFEEDRWGEFTIGENKFRGVKLCERCNLPTINQDTGISGLEPIATLSKYRRHGNKVLFGQNLIPLDFTTINVGDLIFVESYNSMLSIPKNIERDA